MVKCLIPTISLTPYRISWIINPFSTISAMSQALSTVCNELKTSELEISTPIYTKPLSTRPPAWRCKFHASNGTPSTHTDDQCQHPYHPRRKKTEVKKRKTKFNQASSAAAVSTNKQDDFSDRDRSPDHSLLQLCKSQQHSDLVHEPIALDSACNPLHFKNLTSAMHERSPHASTHFADNSQAPCTHSGSSTVSTSHRRLATNAVTFPTLDTNLLSIHDITRNNWIVQFSHKHATILDCNSTPTSIVATATWHKPFYFLDKMALSIHQTTVASARTTIPPTAHGPSSTTTPPLLPMIIRPSIRFISTTKNLLHH